MTYFFQKNMNIPGAYQFIDGYERRPAYQLMSNGELLKFKGDFGAPAATVRVKLSEAKELYELPLSASHFWHRCHVLFKRVHGLRRSLGTFDSEQESELITIIEEKRSCLSR